MEIKQLLEQKRTSSSLSVFYDLIDLSSKTLTEELVSSILEAYQKKRHLAIKSTNKKLLENTN